MLGVQRGRIVGFTDQVGCVLERPIRARSPGVDLELIADVAQVLGRRSLGAQGRAQDLVAPEDAYGRVGGAVAERCQRGVVERPVQRSTAGRRLRPRFAR